MEPIKLALMGAGYWGTKLGLEYSLLASSVDNLVSLNYVVDSSSKALDAIRNQLGADGGHIKFCTDYKDVLADNEVRAVHIALPNQLHYEVARAALQAGKNVLLEKPMAMSAREAFKLTRLSEELGLVLQVGHIFRFNSALRTVKAIFERGVVGRILYANLVWATHMELPSGRDIIFDLAPHPVDVLNYLLNDWPLAVDAIGESYFRKNTGEEEMAFVNLEFPEQVLAGIYMSWIQHGAKERSVRVVGEKGTVHCDALNQAVSLVNKDGMLQAPLIPFDLAPYRDSGQNISILEGSRADANNTIRQMQLHFLDRIRGRGPQFNSALIGAQTVQVLEAITHSMRNRLAQTQHLQQQQQQLPTYNRTLLVR